MLLLLLVLFWLEVMWSTILTEGDNRARPQILLRIVAKTANSRSDLLSLARGSKVTQVAPVAFSSVCLVQYVLLTHWRILRILYGLDISSSPLLIQNGPVEHKTQLP